MGEYRNRVKKEVTMPYLIRYNLSGKKTFRLSWASDKSKVSSIIKKMEKQYGKGKAVVYELKKVK